MAQLPWLEYTGQSTSELIAAAETHRVDSILCAFETALLQKNEADISAEDEVILAVEALEREVNNGGFEQFFDNSSGAFAGSIVEKLRRIGCEQAAEITEKAVAAASRGDAEEIFAQCDQEFYKVSGIDVALFAFVRANAERVLLPEGPL